MKKERLEAFQWNKTKAMLEHAYATVPYYTKLFDQAKIKPQDIKTRADMHKIPITTKKDLLSLKKEDIVSSLYLHKQLEVVSTSGTTGVPFKKYVPLETTNIAHATKLRKFVMNSYKLTWKIGSFTHFYPTKKKWFHSLRLHRMINIFAKDSLQQQIDLLAKKNPEFFSTMPSRLVELAKYAREHQIVLTRPQAILCDSETLTPHDRKLIEDSWHVNPSSSYESREFPNIACECPAHKGFHVDMDLVLLETKNGKLKGSAIITDLTNKAMPLIRYEIGDVIEFSHNPCSCGRNTQMLKEVAGRTNDFFVLPSGKKIAGAYAITKKLYECHAVQQFRVHQHKDKSLEVFIVKKEGETIPAKEIIKDIKTENENIAVKITYVDDLPPLPSVKRQYFTTDLRFD
jgi:phenylacetate-CoA ligase